MNPFLRASPFCFGLDDDATFRSKSFLRSRLVRSLRGSTSSSTERSPEPFPGDSETARQDSDQPPSRGVDGTRGLSTVAEEDLEDWVDDFEAISLADVPPEAEGVGLTESVADTSGVSKTTSGEADSASAVSTAQEVVRSRTISKTSRRSRKSSRRNTGLKLILDFPLPPTFIPTTTRSKPPAPVQVPQETTLNPVHDDESIFYDRDPFRAEPTRDPAEVASVNNPEADTTRVASSASFYTAHSRRSHSRSPTPSVHTDPPPSHHSLPSVHPSSLPPLQFPFPNPSSSPSPQTQTETPSTTRRSIKTLTKASATLKRFGTITRETLRTSFRKPIPELSVRRPRRATRVAHASLEQLPQSSSQQVPDRSPLLPDFQPEAFDISFPAVQTPHVSPRGSRVSRAHPSVQSFYASLEEFLTSHLHSDESNRRSRFLSAPTLLLTTERDPPKPLTEIQVLPPTPPLGLPRPDRPLPPLPREGYDFVDPSTLTDSVLASPATAYRDSPIPPSPSWLSRNVRELEIALNKKAEALAASSSLSACGSDTDVSTVHLPKAVQTQTPSSSTTSSSTRLRGEVVLLRGRVNIQDSKSSQITLRSLTSSNRSPSEATVVLRTRSRSRRNRSGQPQLVISAGAANPPVRPRSRSSSVTKATITHYRRSLVESRKKSRPPRKEDTAKFSTGAKVPKASFMFSIEARQSQPLHSIQTRSFSHSYRLAVTNKPTVSRLPPLEIVPVCECERLCLSCTC